MVGTVELKIEVMVDCLVTVAWTLVEEVTVGVIVTSTKMSEEETEAGP